MCGAATTSASTHSGCHSYDQAVVGVPCRSRTPSPTTHNPTSVDKGSMPPPTNTDSSIPPNRRVCTTSRDEGRITSVPRTMTLPPTSTLVVFVGSKAQTSPCGTSKPSLRTTSPESTRSKPETSSDDASSAAPSAPGAEATLKTGSPTESVPTVQAASVISAADVTMRNGCDHMEN